LRPIVAALAGLAPGSVLAHSPMPGIEGFYIGLVHPATVPAQLLAGIAIGLLLGLAGAAVARPAWGAFAAALAVTLGLSLAGYAAPDPTWLPLPAALAAALACLFTVSRWLAVLLSGASGALIGLGSLPDPGPAGAVAVTIVGTFIGANVLVILLFGGVDLARERLSERWLMLGGRVLAAWLGAIVVLLLAFAFAPRAG
jgi:hypothetical protein